MVGFSQSATCAYMRGEHLVSFWCESGTVSLAHFDCYEYVFCQPGVQTRSSPSDTVQHLRCHVCAACMVGWGTGGGVCTDEVTPNLCDSLVNRNTDSGFSRDKGDTGLLVLPRSISASISID